MLDREALEEFIVVDEQTYKNITKLEKIIKELEAVIKLPKPTVTFNDITPISNISVEIDNLERLYGKYHGIVYVDDKPVFKCLKNVVLYNNHIHRVFEYNNVSEQNFLDEYISLRNHLHSILTIAKDLYNHLDEEKIKLTKDDNQLEQMISNEILSIDKILQHKSLNSFKDAPIFLKDISDKSLSELYNVWNCLYMKDGALLMHIPTDIKIINSELQYTYVDKDIIFEEDFQKWNNFLRSNLEVIQANLKALIKSDNLSDLMKRYIYNLMTSDQRKRYRGDDGLERYLKERLG